MTITGFGFLVLLLIMAVGIFMELTAIPGARARDRGHPQAHAINILGMVRAAHGRRLMGRRARLGVYPARATHSG